MNLTDCRNSTLIKALWKDDIIKGTKYFVFYEQLAKLTHNSYNQILLRKKIFR